jgi:RND family efflux transporter MFP subunit
MSLEGNATMFGGGKFDILPVRRLRSSGRLAGLAVVIALAVGPANAVAGENLRAECVITPSMEVKLASAVSGLLTLVPVARGDIVSAGEVVAVIESRGQEVELELAELRAASAIEVEIAKARLKLARERAQRVSMLFDRAVVSQERLQELRAEQQLAELEQQQAQMNHRAAQLQKELAAVNLALRSIKSPIDGLVVKRLLSPGEFVHQEAQVLHLAQMDPLYVEAYLPATMLPLVIKGGSATVYPQEPVGGAYAAEVSVVDHLLDAASGTFGVRLELPNPDRRLPAGLRCEVVFDPVAAASAEPDLPESAPPRL